MKVPESGGNLIIMRRLLLLSAVVMAAHGAVGHAVAQDRANKPDAQAGTVVAGKHLKVRATASDAIVAPGQRFTLVLDVTPGPEIHVYAPGQDGYIPVAFTVAASEDFTSAPAVFPSPRTIFYEPTAERLKVFDAPFRVTAQVTVAATDALRRRAAARERLTIAGSLDYQACDAAVCYRPDSVPLTWEIGLTLRAR